MLVLLSIEGIGVRARVGGHRSMTSWLCLELPCPPRHEIVAAFLDGAPEEPHHDDGNGYPCDPPGREEGSLLELGDRNLFPHTLSVKDNDCPNH